MLRKLESDDHTTQKEVFERQDGLTKVLTLQSKGYSQSEIARQLNVNQSTICRDMAEIKKKARSSLDLYVKEEIPNEFQFYITGLNQIIKKPMGANRGKAKHKDFNKGQDICVIVINAVL
ncbi:MAG: hypothetical protein ACM3ZS_09330 [Nitrososphaerota archaeon]